jgi:hypothetical protein
MDHKLSQLLYHPKTTESKIIDYIKSKDNLGEIRDAIQIVMKNPRFKNVFSDVLYCHNIEFFSPVQNGKFQINIKKEIQWLLTHIELSQADILVFLEDKNEIDKLFLLEEFSDIENKLERIKNIVGYNLWYFEQLFLIKENIGGLKENLTYLSNIVDQINSYWILIQLDHLSKRAEKNLSHVNYRTLLGNSIKNLDATDEIKEYFLYKLDYISYFNFTSTSFYSYFDNRNTIADRVLSFENIICELFRNKDLRTLNSIKYIIRSLAEILPGSQVINNANFILNGLYRPCKNFSKLIYAYEFLITGFFDDTLIKSKELMQEDPLCIEAYELYIYSIILLNRDFETTGISSLVDDILEHLYNIISRNSQFQESADAISNIISRFFSSSWAKKLYGLLSYHVLTSTERDKYVYSLFLHSDGFNLYTCSEIIYSESKVQGQFQKLLPSNTSIQHLFETLYIEKSINIADYTTYPTIFSDQYIAKSFINNGNIELAQQALEKIIANGNLPNFLFVSNLTMLFDLYLNNNQLREAISIYSKQFVRNEFYTINFDKSFLIEKIKTSEFSGVNDLLALPILFNASEIDDYSKYVSYDEFMSENSYDKPTDIFSGYERYDQKELIYFFWKVCIPEVLHFSTKFDGINDIDEERIKICDFLIEIDKKNVHDYKGEIESISTRLLIRQTIKDVNKGRITINIDQLKANELSSKQDIFKRFLDIQKIVETSKVKSIDTSISKLNDATIEKDVNEDVEFAVGEISFISFKNIIIELRDKFFFSKEYGLDGYLSTRIRHGSFFNQIRSVFESLNLMTQKDSITGGYQNSSYWQGKLPYYLIDKSEGIQNILKDFSQKIDFYTDYIVKEKIQIKTEKTKEKNNALFDFSLGSSNLTVLYEDLNKKAKDYKSFLDLLFNHFLSGLTVQLHEIINHFDSEIKDKYVAIIDEAINELKSLMEYPPPDLMEAFMVAKTNIQDEIYNITDWFNFSDSNIDQHLDISTIIQTSVELTNAIYLGYKIKPIIRSQSEFSIVGLACHHLIYIFKILFDNIVIHSNVDPKFQEVNIDWEFEIHTKVLEFNISNKIDRDIDELKQKLDAQIQAWDQVEVDYEEKINNEGGTGIAKINRILRYDLTWSPNAFNYSINNNVLTIKLTMMPITN